MRGASEKSREGRREVWQSALGDGSVLRPEKNPDRSRRSGFEINQNRRFRPPDLSVAVAVPSAASAASAAASSSATTTILARTGLVDSQGTPLEFLTVQGVNCGLGSVRHFHEAETARFASFAIHDDLCRGDGSVRAEKLAEVIGCCFE
jgi:hypothetical protein